VTTDPSDVWEVKAALESAGMLVLSAESTMVSANTVPVDNIDDAKKILRILDALEDNDDIQDVYSNFDMSDDIMQEASA
jgi:transcriptional/translational regulatory protein YebC/TACO1